MSMVTSGFPGLIFNPRVAVRGPVNPMDKSTVVSIYPRVISEDKWTTSPSRYFIPKGSVKNPASLVVGPASWWREIDDEQPLLEITNSSIQVADAIVKDYCRGLLGCNMQDCMPGLFWVPGEFDIQGVKTKFTTKFNEAVVKQTAYYRRLIEMADILWAKTNGNPLSISEDMRIAARELGQENKDWNKNVTMQELARCLACGSLRNPEYPVCPTCRAVNDVERAKALGLKFALE